MIVEFNKRIIAEHWKVRYSHADKPDQARCEIERIQR